MRIRASTTLVIPLVLIVSACGGGGTPAPSAGASAGRPAASTGGASPAASVGSDASFDPGSGTTDGSFSVKIDGSSFAGTYSSDAAGGGCGVSNGTMTFDPRQRHRRAVRQERVCLGHCHVDRGDSRHERVRHERRLR